jgi:DNA-binding HxlR family transcriptional regulator
MESAVTETSLGFAGEAQPARVIQATPANFAECKRAAVPMTEVLSRIGSKWTVYVIISLTTGPMRFSELKRRIEGVSQKMLTATLRDLEEDGFVTRKVTPTIPPRVDYELTEMGLELRKPLAAVGEWARKNSERVAEARERYAAVNAERRLRA